MSEPKGRGDAWTDKRGTSEEGRQRLEAPRRRANGNRGWRVIFFGLAMVGIVAAVAWALLGSRLLVVRSVVVTGTHLVPSDTVLAMAGVKPGTPMVRVDTAQVQARVASIQQVQSVQVVKSWPDRVVIKVRERTATLAVAVQRGFDLIDPAGVVVRWSATRPGRMPLYTPVAGSAVSGLRGDPSVGMASAVLGELPARLRASVKSVSVPDGQVTVLLSSGVTVVWGDTGRASDKARVLDILMSTHARYYDVSAPGMAMTKQ